MKTKILLSIALLCSTYCATAQVLFSENFNSLPLGKLSNDPTGTTAGQNGWYVHEFTASTDISIVTETGKGNVVYIKPSANANVGDVIGGVLKQKNIYNLWNNRAVGSNILHVEFQYHLLNEFFSSIVYLRGLSGPNVFENFFSYDQFQNALQVSYRLDSFGSMGYGYLNSNPALTNTWISVEIFFDFNTGEYYVYVPTLNLLKSYTFDNNVFPYEFGLSGNYNNSLNTNIGVKYDNIKISAIGTLPTYLGVNDYIASKFNVFPIPATNKINITNNESIIIQQVDLFNINGRMVKSVKLNNDDIVQLNIDDVASGTYLLHIKTKEGTAIKKFIKK